MRVLLIEDDERIVSFVKRGLEAESFGVDVARDGQEGLEMGSGSYKVIILDLALPKKSGNEVCRELRRARITTPLLMLTAMGSVHDKVEGLHLGADDYLTKPFAFQELLARIKALLRRGPYQEIASQLRVADLTLNSETRQVRRGTKVLSLTAREFALLKCLMAHPNRPLSRSVILDQAWGYHHDPLTNVVDVYIRYLRNKVDRGHHKKLIQTVRDIGYKISE